MADGFLTDFRRFFLRGLAAVLPTLLTLAIILWAFSKLDKYVGSPITHGARVLVENIWVRADPTPPAIVADPKVWSKYFWWVGSLLALVGVYLFGRFVASLLGRGAWAIIERSFFRLPLMKQIYPYIKQVTDFLLSEKKLEFSRVVAVEYPRRGIWSLGLITGSGMQTISRQMQAPVLQVFVPSTPTPFTGFVITVRREEVLDLNITVDEAIRFVVSGGVIMPASQRSSPDEVAQAVRAPQMVPQIKEMAE